MNTETITWREGTPDTDDLVVVWRKGGSTPYWVSGWYDFTVERWRDSKCMLLGDVTHWAEIRGPR